jgi:hypothetical protein
MTDRRLVDVCDIEEAKRQQALVWGAIRQAGMLIEAANPQAIIGAIEAEAAVPGGGWNDPDPKVHADLQLKKQLLEAAAAFQREWARIRFETLAATQQGQGDEDEEASQD